MTRLVCAEEAKTYSQSISVLCVQLNSCSSITRSMPIDRLSRIVSTSSGFLKMKWSR